ncbi:MAG: hypothetical protein ACE5F6_20845 [Anaerolineae bacterium]
MTDKKRRRRRRRRGPFVRAHDRKFKKQDLPSGRESVESYTEFIARCAEAAQRLL